MNPRIRALPILLLSFAGATAYGQFKEIKAAPFSPAVARLKIRALIENADAANRDQTLATLSDWLKWYRDILDEELIGCWKSDSRASVPLLMAPLADSRVAREVVEYSWHDGRAATWTLANAAMLGDLMARYPESAQPVLADLLPSAMPSQAGFPLTQPEAEGLCRILLDMPDIGNWRKSALAILPRYLAVTDQLLKQDLGGTDQEKTYRALRWRADLGLDAPAVSSGRLKTRRSPASGQAVPEGYSSRPHIVGLAPDAVTGYTGPMSGTFASTGGPIPQNGEYVFTNLPPGKLLLDFDTKHWEARLAQGDGQTQVLVLRNIGKGPQKRCEVRWTLVP
jgi:hypothetical protein